MLCLVDAFIMAMGVELIKTDIASCWNLREGEIPAQKRDGPFADVILVLNEYARPSHRVASGMHWYIHPHWCPVICLTVATTWVMC